MEQSPEDPVALVDGHAIWRRMEGSPPPPAASAPTTRNADRAEPAPKSSPRRIWRVLDIIGAIIWIYFPVQLLVADIDDAVITYMAPSLAPILAYRFVLFLALFAFAAATWNRWWKYFLYIAFFPLVVAWKVLMWVIRHRSWGMFLGMVQVIALLVSDIRYNVTTKSLAMIAAIFIIWTDHLFLLSASAAYIVVLFFVSIVRRVRQLLNAPSFVEIQRRAIRRVRDSKLVESFITVGDEYLAKEIETYDTSQASQVQMTVAYGIGLNKMLLLWAYQLDSYRGRKRPALIFAGLTYVWVFIAAVSTLTLLNTALLKLDPSQFVTDSPRSMIAILVYTFSTLLLGTAGGMEPAGDAAYLLQLLGAVTGVLVLAGVGLTFLATWLRDRDDTATRDLVGEVEQEANRQADRFAGAYGLSPDEAYAKLNQLGAAAAAFVSIIVQALPAAPVHEQSGSATPRPPNPKKRSARGNLPGRRRRRG